MRERTVLFVDDDAQLRAALARTHRREPYRVLTASGPSAALAVLRSCQVDVLVCDEAMPEMLGTEFIASTRLEFPTTVSILLTGYGSLEVAQRAVNCGEVYRILSKPCPTAVVIQAVRDALEHGSSIERLRRQLREAGQEPDGVLERLDYSEVAPVVFEVDDETVDLHRLVEELEVELDGTDRRPVADPPV